MEINKYIGNKIREFRERKNLTQEDIAEYLNTTAQTISRYEIGDRKANQDILFKLAEYFKVSINDFFPPLSFEKNPIDNFVKENTISDEELERRLKELNEKEGVKIIFDKEGELTEEELNQIVSHAMFVKEQHYKNKESNK